MGMAWLDKLHCVVSRRRTREGSVALEQPSTVLSAQHYLLQYTKGMYLLLPPPSLQKVHVHGSSSQPTGATSRLCHRSYLIRGFQRSQLLPTVLVSAIVDEILRGRRYYYTGLRRYHAHVSMFRLEHMDASRTNDRSLASHYPGSALRMHTIPAGAPERVRPFRASRLHHLCPRRATRAPNATYVSISHLSNPALSACGPHSIVVSTLPGGATSVNNT